jgi:type II secretory pathway pseudopilin PulG
MTFLEVVAAVAMLGIVSAAMFGVFGFVTGTSLRQQRLLGCAEVANRLMLTYLDDPTKMPDSAKPVDYGPETAPSRFRWEYKEEPINIIEAIPEAMDLSRASPFPKDRFRQVTVRVWLSEESGGSRFADDSTPTATLTRLVDPLYPRNPDSFMNMLQDPQAFKDFMGTMMGIQQSTTVRGGATGGRNGQGNQQRPAGNFQRSNFGQGGFMPRTAFNNGGRQGRMPANFNFGPGNRGNGNGRPPGVQPITPPGGGNRR